MPVARSVLVASFVGAFLVAGAAVALLASDRPLLAASGGDEADCGDPFVVLGRMEPTVEDTGVRAGRRVVTFTVGAEGLEGGLARVCTSVGDVAVLPAEGDTATLRFIITRSDDGTLEDVAQAQVRGLFASRSDGLLVAGWHEEDKDRDDRVHVDVELRVPATGPWEVVATSGVGDVAVQDLVLRSAALTSGVGDVALEGDATGDASATSGVGDVAVRLRSVGAGTIAATTGVGDVGIELPRRADVGYDATATTGVGRAEVDIGPVEREERTGGPVGGSVHARSADYDGKPTKVEVHASSGTGDAAVLAR